ncbi:hypothetical protein CAPTEDRAFT_39764, partial [Capitella teleta]
YVAHTRQWRTLPPMSVGRYGHASICDQDEFVVVGGCKGLDDYLNSVECLNLKTLKWSQLPNLPLGQVFSNVVYVQSQLFVIGGLTSSTTVSRDVYLFDSTEKKWQLRSPMPEENYGRVVPFDSKIFILGGGSKCCMQYDPCTDLWIQLQRPLFKHEDGPAVVWKDKIIVCGGNGTDSIEEYDPQSDKWS